METRNKTYISHNINEMILSAYMLRWGMLIIGDDGRQLPKSNTTKKENKGMFACMEVGRYFRPTLPVLLCQVLLYIKLIRIY